MKATADEVMPSVTQYPVKAEDRFGNYIFADDLSTLQGDNIAKIELLDDVTLGADAMLSTPVVVPAGRTVTLDLNGKKLSTAVKSGSELETRHYSAVDNYGTFTLTDTRGGGLIVARGIENLRNGIMTIEDGTRGLILLFPPVISLSPRQQERKSLFPAFTAVWELTPEQQLSTAAATVLPITTDCMFLTMALV